MSDSILGLYHQHLEQVSSLFFGLRQLVRRLEWILFSMSQLLLDRQLKLFVWLNEHLSELSKPLFSCGNEFHMNHHIQHQRHKIS